MNIIKAKLRLKVAYNARYARKILVSGDSIQGVPCWFGELPQLEELNEDINQKEPPKRGICVNDLLASLALIAMIAFSCNSRSQDRRGNFDTAYVEHFRDSTMITVFGKRSLMVHDPVSLFKKDNYYIDSIVFIVPGKTGFFKSNEVSMVPRGGYPFVKGGIAITSDSVKIDLYYNNYDDKVIGHDSYSGNYKLFWKP